MMEEPEQEDEIARQKYRFRTRKNNPKWKKVTQIMTTNSNRK
jgi:hypothetical protein